MAVSAVFGFIIGTVLGSFAKATADRITRNKSLRGRSYCWHCKQQLQWYDLFPVFSFLFLKGRCRYCHKKIPAELLFSEVILGLMVAATFYLTLLPYPDLFSLSPGQAALILFNLTFNVFVVAVLFIIFWTDLLKGLIYDRITYPAIAVTVIFWIILSGLRSWVFYDGLQSSILGRYLLPPYSDYLWVHLRGIWWQPVQAGLTGLMAALFFATLIVVTRGRGMGWGDVKYALFLGLALGFPKILTALFLAFVFGSLYALIMIAMRKKHFGQTIPFGPFLSLGAFIALLFGQQIINWYLKSF